MFKRVQLFPFGFFLMALMFGHAVSARDNVRSVLPAAASSREQERRTRSQIDKKIDELEQAYQKDRKDRKDKAKSTVSKKKKITDKQRQEFKVKIKKSQYSRPPFCLPLI